MVVTSDAQQLLSASFKTLIFVTNFCNFFQMSKLETRFYVIHFARRRQNVNFNNKETRLFPLPVQPIQRGLNGLNFLRLFCFRSCQSGEA